jgi:hypothetical protein
MKMNKHFSWDEVNMLITILREQGLSYLWGNGLSKLQEPMHTDLAPAELIQRLANCSYPLVENASISLFILHPELAPAILEALQHSDPETAEHIAVMTLATLYLQRWWWFRLTFALGRLPDFPEEPFRVLWEERNLPPPPEGYGMTGLLALQEYQQQQYNLPLNFLHDWQNQIDHLLDQEEAHTYALSSDIIAILRQQSLQGQQS